MEAEVKSRDVIELLPETELEQSIIEDGPWLAELVNPEPFELARARLVLRRWDLPRHEHAARERDNRCTHCRKIPLPQCECQRPKLKTAG